MREIAFVVPGALDQLTGGYLFDRHIVEGLRARGHPVQVVELHRQAAASAFASLPDRQAVAIDGLAFTELTASLPQHSERLRLVAFVHHSLADETGLPPDEMRRLAALERELLPCFRGVLCASRPTAAA